MKVMVTGHRPERITGREQEIKEWLTKKVEELKPSDCISGMAQGADQIYAEVAYEKGIPLICAWPYERKLHPVEQKYHDYAEVNHVAFHKFQPSCYVTRDKWMVDNCDIVLAVWDGNPVGGTYDTIEYAKQKHKHIYLFPWTAESITEIIPMTPPKLTPDGWTLY